jgi:hypothetical protein
VQSLSLSLVTAWDEDLADDFGWGDIVADLFGLGAEDEDGLPLVISYRRHKVKSVISQMGSPSLENADLLTITARYAAVPATVAGAGGVFPDQSDRESYLLQGLMDVTPIEPIQATVEVDFGALPDANLGYPLPQRIGEPPPSPLFEVRGVRAAKLDASGEDDEYAFTLDRNDDNSVGLYVEFPLTQPFDLQAPERVLAMAEGFARKLVRF